MFHDALRFLSSIGLLLSFSVLPLHAAIMTFNVNLSGVDSTFGATLRVFGTLTVDPSLPISAAGTSSSLLFQRNAEPTIALPSSPNFGSASPTQLQWQLSSGNLFVTRVGAIDDFFGWNTSLPLNDDRLIFGSGMHAHAISIVPFDNIQVATLKAPGGADGPNGFLVGTTAVPEPSSALLIVGCGALCSLIRRRRG